MIYFWEQDTRLFNVAIVVPMGVLLPLEREEKIKACSTIHPRFQIDKSTTLCGERFIFMLIQLLFLIYFILILLVFYFLIDVIHYKLCRKPSVRLYVIIIIIFSWYHAIERNVSQDIFAHNRKDRAVFTSVKYHIKLSYRQLWIRGSLKGLIVVLQKCLS